MYSGLIGKTSPTVDVLTVLTGTWDERDAGDWHVVMTPFFTILTATLPEGQHPLAYKSEVVNRYVHKDITQHQRDYGNMFTLKVSYRLDHGRSYRDIQRTMNHRDNDTGILSK